MTKILPRRLRKGDVVRFSDSFLRATGEIFVDSPHAIRIGTVVDITELSSDGLQMVTVEDAAFTEPWRALNTNLTVVRRPRDEA